MSETVTAFAPASIGNLAVGFDMLGLALAGLGDRVSARRTERPGIALADVLGPDGEPHPSLSTDPEHNTASIAARALWDAQGRLGGVELTVHKGVPLESGLGSSAASAVAAVVAVNALLATPLPIREPLPFALEGEIYASGGLHADNVAPSLLGKTLKDVVIEPQRVAAVPCFDAVREAAEATGALGVSLSGSGPSVFALSEDAKARQLAAAMEQACRSCSIECEFWVSPMNAPGARVES